MGAHWSIERCPHGECLLLLSGGKYYKIRDDMEDVMEVHECVAGFPDEPVLAAVYAVCSGGDPGSLYAVTASYIIDLDVQHAVIPRDPQREMDNDEASLDHVPHLVGIYVDNRGLS